MSEILILSTAGTHEQAEQISVALVENREAACVNIIPRIQSIYRWEGKVCNDPEFLLIIKSRAEKFEAIRARIKSLNSYAVPEIIGVPVSAGDPAYLSWLSSNCD
ncbi:MAG: CutA1 divalent ion tolerance protein [Acidobacteria bacterium]|jgi:periplasmic divalent cation tolerance protein|nr:CutA1 divalent ion tolerance protein [Acidobacteriota bacterium]